MTAIAHPKKLTGRGVMIWAVCFFAMVFTVNGVMMRIALGTFGGVDTDNAYQAGLAYETEIVKADEQDRRHWRVDVSLSPAQPGSGERQITVEARDAGSQPLAGLAAKASLVHPADRRLDRSVALGEIGAGRYRGTVAAAGAWDFVIELSKGDERLFRSKTRIAFDRLAK